MIDALVGDELLQEALRHRSVKDDTHPSNERLEFLGDAVLGMVVAAFLFEAFPEKAEGELTAMRAAVVSTAALARVATRLGLSERLEVSASISRSRIPPSLLANVFEAVVGAIYVERGFEVARRFVLRHLAPRLVAALSSAHLKDWKNLLQEHTQREDGSVPTYRVVAEEGPEHAKSFTVEVRVRGRSVAEASGRSKKTAEQEAARIAYGRLQDG